MTFETDMLDFLKEMTHEDESVKQEATKQEETKEVQQPTSNSKKVKVGSKEMTPEEYKQYQDIQRMFPDIDWGADAMYTGYETQTISSVPTPLRVK
ncbi:MAG: hypothetical protein RR406_00355 [Bacilli bacterium]